MKLSAKKLARLKRSAEHVQELRDMGADGTCRHVFIAPENLLELIRKYPSP
jgi:hypothetical protein